MSGTKILWGQILTVLLIVLMTTWGATQWTAWQLGFQPQLGHPWFQIAGWPVSAYDGVDGTTVIVLHTPAAMSPLLVRPRVQGGSVAVELDGMVGLMTGDARFDAVYEVRAAEPWFATLVLSAEVRSALVAAPEQQWTTDGADLIAEGPMPRDPLDLLARMAALTAVLESVPWEAYSDPSVPPDKSEVAAALDRRENRLRHHAEAELVQRD